MNLNLKQTRKLFTKKTTSSEVEIGGKLICYFLEDFDRGLTSSMSVEKTDKIKVKKETCIGYGTYEIDITVSQRFGIWLPLLLNVVGFGGIRQHIGNFAQDTEGCQLPGMKCGIDAVSDSTGAFYKLIEIYLNHLTEDNLVTQKLIDLHKMGKTGTIEFGKLFTASRIKDKKIFITISK